MRNCKHEWVEGHGRKWICANCGDSSKSITKPKPSHKSKLLGRIDTVDWQRVDILALEKVLELVEGK